MNRKGLVIMLVILALAVMPALGKEKNKEDISKELITKTYFLDHITPRDVNRSLKAYILDVSGDQNSNMVTVMLQKKNLEVFEKLLKRLDVERKTIQVRIFTVIASNEKKGEAIDNKDLRRVLDELQKVLSFKAYRLDGASFINIKEGGDPNYLELISKLPNLNLRIDDVRIKGNNPGERIIDLGELRLNSGKVRLISTQTSLKENGYLVAGVSKAGHNGDALVLVINAVIK